MFKFEFKFSLIFTSAFLSVITVVPFLISINIYIYVSLGHNWGTFMLGS